MPAGRPKKMVGNEEKYGVNRLKRLTSEYLELKKKSVPNLNEFCLLNDLDYDYLMELKREKPEITQVVKKILEWRKVKLEQGALSGQLNTTFTIFAMKQPSIGWTDKVKVENDVAISKVDELLKTIKEISE